MKALLVCSVRSLFDISILENRAFHAALVKEGLRGHQCQTEHPEVIETTTALDMIRHAPIDPWSREVLAQRYLDCLNDLFWSASVSAYRSVYNALMDPNGYANPKGFVSEYPLLTTNLARAAALSSNATKLGSIVAPPDILSAQPMPEALSVCAEALGVAHEDIEVLVARRVDFEAARSIGMRPKFVEELLLTSAGDPEYRIPIGTVATAQSRPRACNPNVAAATHASVIRS